MPIYTLWETNDINNKTNVLEGPHNCMLLYLGSDAAYHGYWIVSFYSYLNGHLIINLEYL